MIFLNRGNSLYRETRRTRGIYDSVGNVGNIIAARCVRVHQRACKSSVVPRSQINDAFSESLSALAVGTMFYSNINFGRALSRERSISLYFVFLNQSPGVNERFSVNNSFPLALLRIVTLYSVSRLLSLSNSFLNRFRMERGNIASLIGVVGY